MVQAEGSHTHTSYASAALPGVAQRLKDQQSRSVPRRLVLCLVPSLLRYLLFGNRALTRVAWPQLPGAWQGGLWGRSDIAPAVFLLEVLMAYGC